MNLLWVKRIYFSASISIDYSCLCFCYRNHLSSNKEFTRNPLLEELGPQESGHKISSGIHRIDEIIATSQQEEENRSIKYWLMVSFLSQDKRDKLSGKKRTSDGAGATVGRGDKGLHGKKSSELSPLIDKLTAVCTTWCTHYNFCFEKVYTYNCIWF